MGLKDGACTAGWRHSMNEEIETAMKRVQQALEAFEESKTAENARECEWKLTIMKLLIGADNFD